MPILEVQHLYKNFGSTKVLKDISFTLERGKALAIIGSSGSGKTTLLRCLNFLETPNEGKIIVNGETLLDAADHAAKSDAQIRKNRLHFGMVFQSFNLFPLPCCRPRNARTTNRKNARFTSRSSTAPSSCSR